MSKISVSSTFKSSLFIQIEILEDHDIISPTIMFYQICRRFLVDLLQLSNDTLKSFHDVKKDDGIYSELNNTLLQPHSKILRNQSGLWLKFPVYTVDCWDRNLAEKNMQVQLKDVKMSWPSYLDRFNVWRSNADLYRI